MEIKWSAPEFHFFEKGSSWYIITAIIAGILVVFSLWQGNILFVFFTVVAELLVLFWAKQQPRTLSYELNQDGFVVGGEKLFRFNNLTSYALVEDLGGPNYYELVFTQKQPLAPYVKALVPNQSAKAVGDFLQGKLPPFDYDPSLAEAIMKRLGL